MIYLRKATVADIDLLKHWDKQQHVIDCDPDDEWDWESELQRDPEWREQLLAEEDGRPIGFIQIIDPFHEETHYWGGIEENKRAIDIWIGEEENLNKGYGTQMMNLAIKRCFSDPQVDAIFIDPLKTNTKAHRFYERLGFEFLEERKFDGTDCYVYVLKKEQ
jgi:aminoglycoside 6'-N-acetyltransferase